MEGRRHSVDIPISRTLIALRRVKSLRDPSTTPFNKFSPFVDNLNYWETNNHKEITVCLENEQKHAKILELEDKKHGNVEDLCCNNSRRSHSKRVLPETNDNSRPNIRVEGSRIESMSISDRYYSSHKNKGLELACVTPSSNYSEKTIRLNASKPKCQKRYQTGTSGDDVMSCVDSSASWQSNDDLLIGLSHTPSLYAFEDGDIRDSSQCGCGLSWSRTPKLLHRESSNHLGMEDQPLLTKTSYVRDDYECDLYQESPRSLSQKFRPKSFSDLVGQNVVSMSLLSAISLKKITSFYLFHGPRGTGKTSASRIFAAALNCLSTGREKPCNNCRQCVQFLSTRNSDFKELHALAINSTQRIRGIMKNAKHTRIRSRFKVFVIDECHLLKEDTWASFLNFLEDISVRIVFIMITPDIQKLPRLALSRSQKYHFPKIKEPVISNRLEKICIEEGFNFERDALDFIASKSGGSLRDAEMMLEQLSLVGKQITVSLTRDLMGVVSDGEMLDLLHLAMSADTGETVKRARALMRSRIDPLQLVTQLADLIMDILAGNHHQETGRLVQNYTSETEMQQLNRALKILSETEKQLRQSKNQTTWLTVALLQLSSLGSSWCSHEHIQCREGEFCSTSSTTNESVKHLVPCACDVNVSCKIALSSDCQQSLDSVWSRASSICESRSLQNFLVKRGKLLSISHSQGLALTVIGFHNPKYVEKAEKSWKMITAALQHVLGQNVELRIHLLLEDSSTTTPDHTKLKKLSLNFFNCLHKISRKSSDREAERRSDLPEKTDFTTGEAAITSTTDKYVETCSSDYGSQNSIACCNVIRAIRNRDGNVLSMMRSNQSGSEIRKNQRNNLCCLEPDKQPGCLFRTLKLEKFRSSNATTAIEKNAENDLALSIVHTASSQAFF